MSKPAGNEPNDLLSLVFDDLHLTRSQYVFLSGAGQWAASVNLPGRAVFHAVLRGQARCVIEDRCLDLDTGDILIIPAAVAHRICAVDAEQVPPQQDISSYFSNYRRDPLMVGEGETNAFLLTASTIFDAVLAAPLITALPAAFPIHGLRHDPPNWLRIGVQFLLDEMSEVRPGHQFILDRLCDIWFLECLRTYIDDLPEADNTWLRALKDPVLARVLSHMHDQPARSWTVPALAEVAHLSRSAFADRFIRIMGKPPLTYLTEHRMRLAIWQLTHTAQPICHIAEAVGYSSENAFGQAFRRLNGVSPGQYREKMRKNTASQ